MARFATVDGTNKVINFTTIQMTYNPIKGDVGRPAPWRSLSCPPVPPPTFDPNTESVDGPTYTVNASDVTEVWTKRSLNAGELSALKDNEITALDIVAMTILFNHENRIRTLEAKAPITKAQFIAAVKALL
jgi:hypothetical protein